MTKLWQDMLIDWIKIRESDCCGNCRFLKEKSPTIIEDHCSNLDSPFPLELVKKEWYCPCHELKKPS